MSNFEFALGGYALFEHRLKLRLAFVGGPELAPNEGHLRIDHDPQIEFGRLTVPRSKEERERLSAIPATAHLADEPLPFQSTESRHLISSIRCRWKAHDQTIRIEYLDDAESFRLKSTIVERELPTGFPVSSTDVLAECLRGSVQLRDFKNTNFGSQEFGWAKGVEAWVLRDTAEFFGVHSNGANRHTDEMQVIACSEIAQ